MNRHNTLEAKEDRYSKACFYFYWYLRRISKVYRGSGCEDVGGLLG